MRWLVTGAGGMLGRDLVRTLGDAGEEALGRDRSALDVTDADAVGDEVARTRPDIVVNCAAWTDVDGAEADEARVVRVNAGGAVALAAACATVGARLLQLSTDYVFDGTATSPYPEEALPRPLNAYGRAAAAAEQAVLSQLPGSGYVVRTAWLYGEHGANFVKTMLRHEAERETVDVVDDQVGQPTWTVDVAKQLIALGRSDAPPGAYHATSSGQVSWYAFAAEIFRRIGADPRRVRPTTQQQFQRAARRPAYTVLGHARWLQAGMTPIGPWRESLEHALPRIIRPPAG